MMNLLTIEAGFIVTAVRSRWGFSWRLERNSLVQDATGITFRHHRSDPTPLNVML